MAAPPPAVSSCCLLLLLLLLGPLQVASLLCEVLHPGSFCSTQCPAHSTPSPGTYPLCFQEQQCCLSGEGEGEEVESSGSAPTTQDPSLLLPTCGAEAVAVSRRVVDLAATGHESDFPCRWPWMVSLRMRVGTHPATHFCGGVLLSNERVLTTAACIYGLRWTPMVHFGAVTSAMVGECDLTQDGEPHEQEVTFDLYNDVRVLDSYDPNSLKDNLALIRLNPEVDLDLHKLPACLPDEHTQYRANSSCVMAGWGRPANGTLRTIHVTSMTSLHCRWLQWAMTRTMPPPHTFCTDVRRDGADACKGDEGGMLVCLDGQERWTLRGVISRTTCLETTGHANQLVDVAVYRQWLDSTDWD